MTATPSARSDSTDGTAAPPTSRARARVETLDRILAVSRRLLVSDGEVSLRAVARELGLTAPALYRYAASHGELVRMVAFDIDSEVAARIRAAAERLPGDDPPGRLVAAAVEFRSWALGNREEFSLVFTNLDVECLMDLTAESSTGMCFSELLFAVWERHPFPLPALDDLDPELAEILRDPMVPADLSGMPDEARGLVWILQRAWSRLYGAVTLEVFRHIDPRIVEHAFLFRAMLEDQAGPLDLVDELPRLQELVTDLLSR